MAAVQGTIEANGVNQMVEIVAKLTCSGVLFDVKSKGSGVWLIEIKGA
jgi:hypothetical protein